MSAHTTEIKTSDEAVYVIVVLPEFHTTLFKGWLRTEARPLYFLTELANVSHTTTAAYSYGGADVS